MSNQDNQDLPTKHLENSDKNSTSNGKTSFKQTPIPYRNKSGEPMTYFVLSEDGNDHIKVSRTECLTRIEEPDNPYPQRWFVDEESGLVVRLPRNEKGENIARENMTSVWREAKYNERKFSCADKGSSRCPKRCSNCPIREECESKHKSTNGTGCGKKCEYCNLSNTSRTVELDMHFGRDEDLGENESHFEPVDPSNFEATLEDAVLLSFLNGALEKLSPKDRDLIDALFYQEMTERQYAKNIGVKQSKGINKRKQRILRDLRKDDSLNSFHE